MKIALIGLDGSGKSANINLMKSDPEYKEFEFLWVRWQPSITVMLYKIRHRNDTVGARNNSESGKKRQKTLEGNYQRKKGIKKILFGMGITRKLWFFYAIGDYKRQFHNKTQQLIANGSNIIFDRYYLDLFIDQGINFGYSPEKIFQEIEKYKAEFPVMDKIIYIKVSPDVCFARKDDIPNMEYLSRRYEIYEYIAKKQNWYVIDGEKELPVVYDNIKSIILDEVHYEKR